MERIARIAADGEGRAILIDEYEIDEGDVEQAITWADAAAKLATHA